jgi:hypothetical protein
MGGFLGIGNSSAKADRNRALGGWGVEQNLFNYAIPTAEAGVTSADTTTNSGLGTMEGVKKYFTDIMSGSRPTQMAAAAPEINAATDAADASRRARATFGTARGGGVNAGAQTAETDRMTAINNALFGARAGAAKGAAAVGESEATIGVQKMANALRMLGMGEDAVQHFINSSITSRKDSQAINVQTQNQIRQFASQLFSGMAGMGGGVGGSVGGVGG